MDEHHRIVERLQALGRAPVAADRQRADLAALAALSPSTRRPWLAGKVRVAGAFLAGLLIGSTGLAAADALPDPAQHVAHTVLDRVGVQVPDPERYHGPECGPEVAKNHGGYVRDDPTLAQTDCGKKAKAASAGDDADEPGRPEGAGKPAKGPCQGKPSWAGDRTMTDEQKAAAQAERAAQCGPDDAEGADELEAEAPAPAPAQDDVTDPSTTTTTSEAPVTTEPPTTTEVPTTEPG